VAKCNEGIFQKNPKKQRSLSTTSPGMVTPLKTVPAVPPRGYVV